MQSDIAFIIHSTEIEIEIEQQQKKSVKIWMQAQIKFIVNPDFINTIFKM